MTEYPHRADEKERERNADDENGEAGSQTQARHGPGEIEDTRRQRQKHVHESTVGARVADDAEESVVLLRFRFWLGEWSRNGGLHRFVLLCNFLWRSVGLDDRGQDLRFSFIGIARDLALKVLLRIGECVADQPRRRSFE